MLRTPVCDRKLRVVISLMRIPFAVAATVTLSGCISLLMDGVDPAQAAPNVGYVDFYSKSCDNLRWSTRVKTEDQFAEEQGTHELIGSTIRLERPVGTEIYFVSIIRGNADSKLPTESAAVQVQVTDGMVTPVQVSCPATGQIPVGYSWVEPYGINMIIQKTGTRMDSVRTVELVAEPAMPFARKSDMPYACTTPLFGRRKKCQQK